MNVHLLEEKDLEKYSHLKIQNVTLNTKGEDEDLLMDDNEITSKIQKFV